MANRVELTERDAPRIAVDQLEEGLQIDEHALDDALVRQPDMFYRVSKHLALLTSKRDAKKQELSEEEARADAEFRNVAHKQKDKTTETELKNMIRLDRAVRKVSDELLALNRKVGEVSALKEAYQQRSYVLKDLVNLYIANYYSSNNDGGGSGRLRDHRAQHARDEINRAERRRQHARD